MLNRYSMHGFSDELQKIKEAMHPTTVAQVTSTKPRNKLNVGYSKLNSTAADSPLTNTQPLSNPPAVMG